MRSCRLLRGLRPLRSPIGLIAAVLSMAIMPQAVPSRPLDNATPVLPKSVAARVKEAGARCRAHAGLDACDDAVRWSPNDPTLLVAYGDALARDGHRGEALRQYRRAVILSPRLPGIAAKIKAMQTHAAPKRAPLKSAPTEAHATHQPAVAPPPPAPAPVPSAAPESAPVPAGTYSNDSTETHTH